MKVLFDVNMPRPLLRELTGHEVVTAQSMGWSELQNGELLNAAEGAGFEAHLTLDQNLAYQQNLTARRIAIVVVPTNKLEILKGLGPGILQVLSALQPGSFVQMKL